VVLAEFTQGADLGAGWAAIERAVARLAPGSETMMVMAPVPTFLGGSDPLEAVSIISRVDPIPHWHYVGFGLSELYEKTGPDSEWSGWGFEFTFRLAATGGPPPGWPVWLLQQLARHVLRAGQGFAPGSALDLGGPISRYVTTDLAALLFVRDPELSTIDTPHGRVQFLQAVGVHASEYRAIRRAGPESFLSVAAGRLPVFVTDLARPPLVE